MAPAGVSLLEEPIGGAEAGTVARLAITNCNVVVGNSLREEEAAGERVVGCIVDDVVVLPGSVADTEARACLDPDLFLRRFRGRCCNDGCGEVGSFSVDSVGGVLQG